MAVNSNMKQEKKERKKVETTSGLDVPSPTEAIVAFGGNGDNQIWRSGKKKWEEWEGKNCGKFYASLRVKKSIFIIGGLRKKTASTCTDIYNIDTKTWSEGPKLNIARLDKSSQHFILDESVKPNVF